MTLLDEKVWVGICNNAEYYESLGYEIPRYKNKWGQLSIKRGTKILVDICDLQLGSRILVKYVCDYCNGDNQINESDKFKHYFKLINGRNKVNKDCCKNEKCKKMKLVEIKKLEPIPKGKSFGEKFPHLISEWSNRNATTPFQHYYGSDEVVWWNCPDCRSEYDMKLSSRGYHECNCPFCSSHRTNHTNCLWTTHPEVAKLLKVPERGYNISAGSNKKEKFICPNCNYSEDKIIQYVVQHGFPCPKCSDGISYPEKFLYNMFLQIKTNVERQKVFSWSENVKTNNKELNGLKKYDFYLPEFNTIVETHGEQHYVDKRGHFRNDFNTIKENDFLKEKIALENGIINYIIINCINSDKDYIRRNILNSKLNNILCLERVNWDDCHSYAISSLVKEVCLLWGKYNNTKDIADKLKISNVTARRYLIQGSEIGLCNYDPQEELSKTRKNNLKKVIVVRSVKVIQLTKEGEFIKEWNSISDAKRKLHINNISAVLNGKQKTAGGFIWMYKKDYETLRLKEVRKL